MNVIAYLNISTLAKIKNNEFVKYFISGCVAFGCDILVLVIFTEYLDTHYLVSNIAGYSCGLVVAYYLNTKWVFLDRKYQSKSLEFSIFNLIVFFGFLLNELLLYVFVEFFSIHYTLSKFISGFLVFMFNYIVKKVVLFSASNK